MPRTERTFIYCRISEDRHDAGLGIERQLEECQQLASQKGFEVTEVFKDNDTSAFGNKPRPEYQAMLSRLDEVQHVLIWNTDRLHRKPRELEEYAELTIKLRVLTHAVQGGELSLATPQGRLNARIYASIASYESEHKAARIRSKVRQTVLDGRSVSNQRAFGFDIEISKEDRANKRGGRYVINEREASALRTAVDEILGGRPMNSVRMEWNREDREGGSLLNTRGTPWDASNFRRMLVQPRNAGLIAWEGEVVPSDGKIPAIISYERWKRLCDHLDRRLSPGHSGKAVTLGAGIIHCPCGSRAKSWHVPRRRKDAAIERTYRCMDASSPGVHPTKRAHLVDGVIRAAVWQWFGNPLKFEMGVMSPEEEREVSEKERVLGDISHRLNALEGEYAVEGGLPFDALKRMSVTLTRRRSELIDELADLRSRVSVSESPFIRAVERAEDQARRFKEWTELDLESQRDMLKSSFHIVLHPTPKSAPRIFDPNTVEIRLLGPGGTLPEELPPPGDPYDESGAADYLIPGARVGSLPDAMSHHERHREHNRLLTFLETVL